MTVVRSWDVFCRVVDNFGDAAVCWRLVQRLADINASALVRLWIDDLSALHALAPGVSLDDDRQRCGGIEIHRWLAQGDTESDFETAADVVVDAFGCGLPDAYTNLMVSRTRRPVWIVLEYLSAEPWVAQHHGLPSPHPRLPLSRYFFFPGFGPGTGGVLAEAGLSARRAEFLKHPTARLALWRETGFAPPDRDATVVTLFGYENPALGALLQAWREGPGTVVAAIPDSRVGRQAADCLGLSGGFGAGQTVSIGALQARFMPFLDQVRYDELLWAADWNFVRGEDSFIRAQWAERPFVWHAYPQAEAAHLVKLNAFLGLYSRHLATELARPLADLWHAWNQADARPPGALRDSWQVLSGQGAALCEHAHRWSQQLAQTGDLAENLANFCESRLK